MEHHSSPPICSYGSMFTTAKQASFAASTVAHCSTSTTVNTVTSSSERMNEETIDTVLALQFIPPTNQASATQYNSMTPCHRRIGEKPTESFLPDSHYQTPCLPVSKGCIKKMAQTRFVNSSPRSYRLMPASAESSDMTSFMEKSPYRHVLPATFMLQVAELWMLSKHHELECVFTFANSEEMSLSDKAVDETKLRTPICHPTIVPAYVHCPCSNGSANQDSSNESVDSADSEFKFLSSNIRIDKDLLKHVEKFLKSHSLKEQQPVPMRIAGGSGT